nr:uncharacterized protein LOC123774153 [Procambarus clarkii]
MLTKIVKKMVNNMVENDQEDSEKTLSRRPPRQSRMVTLNSYIAAVIVMGVSSALTVSEKLEEPKEKVVMMVDQAMSQVGEMVSQVVDHHLIDCHLVLISTTRHSYVASNIHRRLSAGGMSSVVLVTGLSFNQDQLNQDQLNQDQLNQDQDLQNHLKQGLWGDARTTCRGLILDLTVSSNTTVLLR